jgi:hypothetical protein
MEYQDKYDELLRLITQEVEIDGKMYNLKEDFDRFFVRSNKTAGRRLRRLMQEIKKLSQEIRVDVQNYKSNL